MQKTILLLKRALSIPYVNRIDFFALCVYKNVSQKNGFCVWMKISITRKFIYTKSKKKLRNVFIYKKPDTFQKARQFPLRFYTQKAIHWRYGIFMEFLKLEFIFKKHDTLRYVTFIYSKSMTLRKKQYNLRYVFIYRNPALFRYAIFIEFLKFAEGGGIYLSKNNVLCVTFLYWKNNALCVTLLYIQRAWHYALHFNIQKRYTFFTFIYI